MWQAAADSRLALFCSSARPLSIMEQEDRSGVLGRARFEAARCSVVLRAAQSRAEGGPEVLAQLCERYWPPLYAFARHRGHLQEDAQDLVQGFFEHLLQTRALGAVDDARGRFRSFLLASFQNFMAMERRRSRAEKCGGAQLIRIDWQDANARIGIEPRDPLTPETLYDARWALDLIGRATQRLEKEQTMLGKAQAFRILRPFLGDEGVRASPSHVVVAKALNVGLPAVKTLIHRLRRRHAQLMREEVAQTVLDPDEVQAEIHALCEALVQAEGRVRS
jgi:RNA polymerase sigma factor (sigma-70 family)